MKDFVNHEAVELAVVGFQNELAVSAKVVISKQSGDVIHSLFCVTYFLNSVGKNSVSFLVAFLDMTRRACLGE